MHTLLFLAACAAAVSLAACNTVQGLGQDVSAAGQAVSQTAREAAK